VLTFRNTNIALIVLLGIAIWADKSHCISWLIYAAILLVYSLILFYGVYYVGSNFFMRMYCSAKTAEKVIALTFDDGPVKEGTAEVLQILNNANVQAAFFVIGGKIAGNEDLIRQLDAAGHIVGNHSYTHAPLFDLFPAKKMLAEMQQTDSLIAGITGKKPRLFRPPYGVMNPNLKKAILAGNYFPIGWNARSYDTMFDNADKLYAKVAAQIKPGAVFLFHDKCPVTIAMLPRFIAYTKAQGYRFIRADKILGLPAYAD